MAALSEKLRGSFRDNTCEAESFCTTHCLGKCYHPDNKVRQDNVKKLQIKVGIPEEKQVTPSPCPDGTSSSLCKFKH